MVTDFFGANRENWHIPLLFCALAFHNEWNDRNMDARFNIADDPSTSDKN